MKFSFCLNFGQIQMLIKLKNFLLIFVFKQFCKWVKTDIQLARVDKKTEGWVYMNKIGSANTNEFDLRAKAKWIVILIYMNNS